MLSRCAAIAAVTVVTFVACAAPDAATRPIEQPLIPLDMSASIAATPAETPAALPRVYMSTSAPPAPDVGGKIIRVSTAKAFQAALASAAYGDVIELANASTYVGNFTLPNKGANNGKWITIRPATRTALPPEGARMTPKIAALAQLPLILSANNYGAISTALGAHHWRLIGLEVSVTPNNPGNTGLVRFGDGGGGGQVSAATTANNLTVDRCYIHGLGGNPLTVPTVRRGVALNSAWSAVIDSYVSEIHERITDAQAVTGWNGPGPFKITNNYLEASGENLGFGGADPDIPNLVPADIEIRHNHLSKQLSWKGVYLVKNLLESKSSMRVLVEGNLLENNWLDGQGGSAINLKSTNQGGACPGCSTQDWTIRLNLIRNTGAGIVLSANPDPHTVTHKLQRVTIVDNVFTNIDVAPFTGDGRGVLINQDPADITLAHNTIISPTSAAVGFGGPQATPPVRLSIRDNIIGGGQWGVKGPGLAAGTTTINTFMAPKSFVSNAIVLSTSKGYPAANWYPLSVSAVGFTSPSTFGFKLLSTSPYRLQGTDNHDVGANTEAMGRAIIGVIVP